MYKLILLYILFFCFSALHSEDNDYNSKSSYLIVEKFNSSSVSKININFINRMMLVIGARQQKYKLTISDNNKNSIYSKTAHHLRVIVNDLGDGFFDLEAQIFDIKRNKLIRRVQKKRFKEEEIKKIAELSLYLLFGDYIPNAQQRIKKLSTTKEDTQLLIKEPNKDSVNLVQRINRLRKKVKSKSAEVVALNNKEKLTGSDQDLSKKEEEKKKNQNSVILSKEKNPFAKREAQQKEGDSLFVLWYSLGVRQSNFLIKDRLGLDEQVDIRSQILWLSANVYIDYYPSFSKRFGYFLKLSYIYPSVSENISLDTSIEYDLGFMHSIYDEDVYLRLSYRRDTQSFINLPELGEGLKVATLDVDWIFFGFHHFIWRRSIYWRYEYAYGLNYTYDEKLFMKANDLLITKQKVILGVTTSFLIQGSYFEFAYQPTFIEASTGDRVLKGSDLAIFGQLHFKF